MATDPQLSDGGTLAIKPPRANIFARPATAAADNVAASASAQTAAAEPAIRVGASARTRFAPSLRAGLLAVVLAAVLIAWASRHATTPDPATRSIDRFRVAHVAPPVTASRGSASRHRAPHRRGEHTSDRRRRRVLRRSTAERAPRKRHVTPRRALSVAPSEPATPRPSSPAPAAPVRPAPSRSEPKRPIPARVPDGSPPEFL